MTKQQNTAITVPPTTSYMSEAQALISQAINKKVPVETMEKLLAMRRELKAEAAKEAFDLAMAKFQQECPVIEKMKRVYEKNSTTKVRYSFAPIEDIIEQVKEMLAKNGLSYAFKTIQTEKDFGVICIAKHQMGHSEETSFTVPIGTEEYMTNVQKFGARNTFCKRYAFCNAFGISTGDEDTDADVDDKKAPAVKSLSREDIAKINATKTQEDLVAVCKEIKGKLPDEMKNTLVNEYTRRKNEISDELADEVAKGIEEQKAKEGKLL